MSFDGVLLHKLMAELNLIKSGRISKIIDSGDTDFIFTIRVNGQNRNLMLSFSSDYSRIHFTKKQYDSPLQPKSITMLLRKHIEGYFIEDIQQYHNDRIITFTLGGYNEMRDFTTKYLICEIMGRYSNLILTDQHFKILEVLKHDGVSEFNRTMLPNAIYIYPKTSKKNPFQITFIQSTSPKELCNELEGTSMLLAQYCFKNDLVFSNLKEILEGPIVPCLIYNEKGKKDFYIHPLDHSIVVQYNSISELLENFYYEMDTTAKIKLKTNDLASFIEKQIHKNEKKLHKLQQEQIEAEDADRYKLKGELLLSLPHLKAKEKNVEVWNYYTNQLELIELDSRFTILENSNRFYKKYQKSKTAIHHIKDQMEITEQEIKYFKMLSSQLQICSINDALEMRQELLDQKYLLKSNSAHLRKKKPNYLTYIVDDVEISVGKNNIQNEYITHHLSKSNDMWFHVKDASGSHVVAHTTELTENIIRTAANIAAFYSSLSLSSSVPVDYTLIRNIKKIPGKRACFVTYTKQKTIYIDPDYKQIESLRIKK